MKKRKSDLWRFWRKLGPGLITGSSDDDPSGIATYSQAGAKFGLSTLWTALITFPLMYAVQEMCARIGVVTKQGLAGIVKKHYPRWVIQVLVIMSAPAILLNIGADIAGMGAVANMIFPSVPATLFSILFALMNIAFMLAFNYRKFAAVMKYLCLILLVYFIVPFLYRRTGLCAGGEIAFRLPVTEVQFRDKCSLFILLLIDIHQAETKAGICK